MSTSKSGKSANPPTVVFTYRYMWKLTDSDKVFFKIISETTVGIDEFEKGLLLLPKLEHASKQYLHEYDVNKLSDIITLKATRPAVMNEKYSENSEEI
ncbi:hypothetical protein [Dipodfec virus UOA04_Rod_754]|nr:hypothetical protein [Dipodfec virus UOA04_Rod_754]